jgi:organic hydroperoxide reductase OsmC/OhrA
MNVVYSTTVSSVGGRDGTIRSDDGMLDLKVARNQSHEVVEQDIEVIAEVDLVVSSTRFAPIRTRFAEI